MKTSIQMIGAVIIAFAMVIISANLKMKQETLVQQTEKESVKINLPFEPRTVKKHDIYSLVDNYDPEEFKCLSEAIFYEAGNQSIRGKEAVALVILNRSNNNNFPLKICDVVSQKRHNQQCQFSYFCKKRKVPNGANWIESMEVAEKALNGEFDKIAVEQMQDVLYFHADYVKPRFHQSRTLVTKIENHLFYR